MDDHVSCLALVEFTGLDQESTMTQILPYLKSMKTKAEVVEYLHSLIGQGPKQASFIQRFSEQRFRASPPVINNQNQKKLDSAFPSLLASQRDPKSDKPPDIDIPISEFTPSCLEKLIELEGILKWFEPHSSTPAKVAAQCFCESRDHGLPIGRLPKQCAHCGLIYCRLKPALTPCPSCSQQTPLSSNTDLRENIRAEFVAKRKALIDIEVDKYQKRVSAEQKKALAAQEADRAYPSLPTSSSSGKPHSHPQPQTASNRYSNQLHPRASIQSRIRQGYDRLAQEHMSLKGTQNNKPSPSSHTVLRLNSSNGKTKIIKTTKKNLPANRKPQDVLMSSHDFDPQFSGEYLEHEDLAYVDAFDDLSVRAAGRLPLPSVDRQLIPPQKIPGYVPMDVYQV
ncbi:hypothetical protein PCANC_02882 [Puccinia coronata f. sp. avenae]|uniref:TRIP4/RQT4 C2HC5-type zinc finger domain-containing protein n=1 Tax=Puccinia coronata f. sp. avenae TaxID=200324 RepID=A0A2N5T8G3_9BASI|nr:hypothetical protein PCANC_02882 [Puccinia coronata f. sp. avenae]